jgi:hypothetical protein
MLLLALIGLMSIACSLFVLYAGILSSRINQQAQEFEHNKHRRQILSNQASVQTIE